MDAFKDMPNQPYNTETISIFEWFGKTFLWLLCACIVIIGLPILFILWILCEVVDGLAEPFKSSHDE